MSADDNRCGSEWGGCPSDDDNGVHRCDLVALHEGLCVCGNRYMGWRDYPRCDAKAPRIPQGEKE